LAPVIRDTPQFRASLQKAREIIQVYTDEGVPAFSDDGLPVTYSNIYLPDMIARLRRSSVAASGFKESGVASALLSTIYSSISDDEMSNDLSEAFKKLQEMAYSADTPWQPLRLQMIKVYDLANLDKRFVASLQTMGVLNTALPTDMKALFELANHPDDPRAIPARGLIGQALFEESKLIGSKPSLTPAGRIALNSNRIFQELRYLGYSCAEARGLVSKVRGDILRSENLTSDFRVRHVRYSGGGFRGDPNVNLGVYTEFPYPRGLSFNHKTYYPASKPLDPSKVPDLTRQYRGQYRVTDFAIGAFDNVEMNLEDPRVASAALNLIRSFPTRSFTFTYSPVVAKAFGIVDFPRYMRSIMTASNVPHTRVAFRATKRGVEILDAFAPWVRDGWLSALNSQGGRVKLQKAQFGEPVNGAEGINLSTEGGAHYPIGQYIFLNKQRIWGSELYDATPEAVSAYKERYRTSFGREPILLDFGSPQEGASDHVDLYLIFLPQASGKPAIGVADLRLGRRLLSTQDKNVVVARDFLDRQRSLRLPLQEKPVLQSFEPASLGIPEFTRLGSFESYRGQLDISDSLRAVSLGGLDADTLDANAEWLRQQGFEVFRFPYLPGYSQANGIPELSAVSATFTTVAAPAFNEALAEAIGRYGYSLKLMPNNDSISDGAGYHCLTNEARF
jgi:hypothetical protein